MFRLGLQGPECGHEVPEWLISKSFSFSVRKDIFAQQALGLTNRMKRLSGRLRALGAPLQEHGSLSQTAGLCHPGPPFPPAVPTSRNWCSQEARLILVSVDLSPMP